MRAVGFYLFYIFNSLITLLPLKVLYILSDLLYTVLYYLIRYRRKTVATNLLNAFPEKSDSERLAIGKKFYRHLADIFIETLKITQMSEKEVKKRSVIENPELLKRLYNEGKDITIVLGHYNNWEILLGLPLWTDFKCLCVYKPLKNKYFDRFMYRTRSRLGMVLTPMSMILREIISNRDKGIRSISAFLSDQTPARKDINYRTKFLNQDTAVYLGAEKISSKYNMAVIFYNNRKIRRGYYSARLELLFENTKDLPDHVITDAHVKRLEEIITEKPEYWIWSHRRWKHKEETI